MILPPTSVAAGPATSTLGDVVSAPSPSSPGSGYSSEQWNSIIGIVTAIVGNVMISFALNTQRYAHIRLEREWQEKERRRKKRSASYRDPVARADERLQKKLSAGRKRSTGMQERDSAGENERARVDESCVASEEAPLLPAATPSRRDIRSRPHMGTIGEEGQAAEGAYRQESYLKSPYWWAGIILMTTGEAGNFLAYGFAPASIVSPLGVVALISNCIIAPFMLKEPFRARDALGLLVAVGGAVTVVLSASDNNPKLGPDEIWDLITTWEFETYLGITIGVIAVLMVASNRYGDKSILIDLGLVGLFGGYTALSTKGVASMLSYTLWRAITFPVTYLLVAILVGTAIMQIKYVNRALQRFDATQVIPVQFVLFTLSVILGSAILYRDFERTSGEDAGKFVGGCAMTFLGVWLITSGRPPRTDDDEEDRDPEDEDAINLVDGERYHDGIDGEGEEGGASRRSSTIRVGSPPMDIIRRPSTREQSQPATPNSLFASEGSVPRTPTPRGAPDAPSSLTMNPWEQEQGNESPLRPRPTDLSRHTTVSTPILPSEAMDPSRPSTSTPEPRTNLPLPHTPTRNTSDTAAVTPGTQHTNPRLRRIGTAERMRNSIPGPLLASPLSTSLSAMVADLKRSGSVRGHAVHRDNGDVKRRQSVLGIGADEIDEGIGEPLDRRRTHTDEERVESVGGRGRSLSGTLGDLWRGFRGQGDGDGAADEERGEEGRP
ncbi:DUF803-domain-containing protein [Lentithecium fluviatile CBS 122367]|uniref:DUF803-domain-containing protein n=1 Tax=Lentithecium fluviatile CBS 122367 TaxID=1168545 RepID=A0A6G1IPT7_9PLEO|nr:DUF803-domain-containing protein [Lentithecium fluviatile CBS 122367]